ncbi:MAG TPA: FtsH protease activity modulator HflK [Chthoniobacteraceae bacterium]|nr:FtsH protease activity modulator HflK [Chthoniobacteraceae bacterium]
MKNVSPPNINLPNIDLRWIPRVAIALVALWAFFSCYTAVPADSVGVLTRFGRFVGILEPGLRFRLPFGVDQVQIVEIQRQMKLEFGFGTRGGGNPYQESPEPDEEASMVTGDLNMASVEWVVQYRIDDARDWVFNVFDPQATLRDASESAMREVIGDRTVDEVLTVGRQEIEDQCLVRLKELSNRYNIGASIMQVQLKNVHPPLPVQASFNAVNQAQQEREQQINLANGEYNKAVPRARGQADQKISEAEGYALQRVNEARGDAQKFTAVFQEYVKAPEVTRQRLYFETMKEVLPTMERKIILDDKATGILPLLNLQPSK